MGREIARKGRNALREGPGTGWRGSRKTSPETSSGNPFPLVAKSGTILWSTVQDLL
jgi:hypothetical protein